MQTQNCKNLNKSILINIFQYAKNLFWWSICTLQFQWFFLIFYFKIIRKVHLEFVKVSPIQNSSLYTILLQKNILDIDQVAILILSIWL